jgi:hypothetical protein
VGKAASSRAHAATHTANKYRRSPKLSKQKALGDIKACPILNALVSICGGHAGFAHYLVD